MNYPRDYYCKCCGCTATTPEACGRALYGEAVLVILMALMTLIIGGVMLVEPWRRTAGFQRTECVTVNVSSSWPWRWCDCGRRCTSSYPCMQLIVQYNVSVRQMRALLHDSQYELQGFLLCSYKPGCDSSKWVNKKRVENYIDKWGTLGTRFACAYNPAATGEVLRERRGSQAMIVHIIMWPMVIIAACVVTIVLTYRKFGCGVWVDWWQECCNRVRTPPRQPLTATFVSDTNMCNSRGRP